MNEHEGSIHDPAIIEFDSAVVKTIRLLRALHPALVTIVVL
jgi:hypothetical protein